MTNPVNIGSTSGVLWFFFCFRFRFVVLLARVISAEDNEGFSFPETGQFNFFISRKRYISVPRKCHIQSPPKKHFNLSKIASLISRKDKFQSPENRNIVISQKWHISISENDTIQSPKNGTFQSPEHDKFQSPENWSILISRKWDISISRKLHISISRKWHIWISWERQILISRKLKYYNFPQMTYFNLPNMTHFDLPKIVQLNLPKVKHCSSSREFPKKNILQQTARHIKMCLEKVYVITLSSACIIIWGFNQHLN